MDLTDKEVCELLQEILESRTQNHYSTYHTTQAAVAGPDQAVAEVHVESRTGHLRATVTVVMDKYLSITCAPVPPEPKWQDIMAELKTRWHDKKHAILLERSNRKMQAAHAEFEAQTTRGKFITDWRLLEVGVPYWMICRADPDDRNIIEIRVKSKIAESVYACMQMNDSKLWRFRENTHVYVRIEEAPAVPKELQHFPD